MSGEGASPGPFNPRLILPLVGAGILAFGVFMLLLAYAGDLRSGRDGRPHPLSVSAIGFRGLVDLIGLTGGEARLIRDPRRLDTDDLLVVSVEPRLTADQLEDFLRLRRGSATLIILPKWAADPDPLRAEWVRSRGAYPELAGPPLRGLGFELAATQVQDRVARGSDFLAGLRVPVPAKVHSISGDGLIPLLVADTRHTIVARMGDQPHYILADPDLLNNQGLKDPASARAALRLIEELNATDARGVAFDLTLNGFAVQSSLLKLAFEPPFVALTIALFVAALLAGLHGLFRFGPEVREARAIPLGKAALVENSAGLFRLARREHRVGGAYAEMVRTSAAAAAGAPAGLSAAELDLYLDRLTPAGRPGFTSLAAALARAENRDELVAAAKALFVWKKDLIP